MGLSPTPESPVVASTPAIAPAAKGILDPATGKPVGASDPFFLEVNHELSDKGFFVAAADDLVTWARTGSLMWMTFPHQPVIADLAQRMLKLRAGYRQGQAGTKVLFAGGPAIVHAGGREALTWLIEAGFIQVLFCGNALAAHDLEAALYGTSLGYGLSAGRSVPHRHEHHLRTINRVRAIGSIHEAVRSGVITEGIMAACVRHDVRMVMAGTIRDDGPLPGVVTDSMQAQQAMRAEVQGVGLALLVASTLHAIATGNLLPATVPTVCVDVNPSVPTKLADRGSFQAVGIVMDAASFLKELARELGWRL